MAGCREVLSLVGPELAVNVKTHNHQFEAATASSLGGMSVIAWTDVKAGADTDIRARLYNAAGNPVGGDIVVNNSTFADSDPAVAMDRSGRFVVAWTRTLPSGDTDVQVARFSAAGANLNGVNGSLIVGGTARPESDPSAAIDGVGNFVVSYTRVSTPGNQDILARRYDSAGVILGDVFVSSLAGSNETRSSASRSSDGRFVIAYQVDTPGLSSDIRMRLYTAAGGYAGVYAVAATGDAERSPSVSLNDSGNGVVAYQRITGRNSNIRARRFTFAAGMGGEINVRSTSAGETAPKVAIQRSGNKFVATYIQDLGAVMVTEVSAANVPVYTAKLDSRYRPSVSIDARSVYQVAYETLLPATDGSGIGIRRRRGLL
ncbi:MAG: hypothetical protein U0800_19420 [Isosphaeraceae bacterium]